MNRKSIVLLCILSFIIGSAYSQKADDPAHENHFKQLAPIETDTYKVEFSDAHAQQAFCMVKMKISNKTKDFLALQTGKIVFQFEHGTYTPKDKQIIIKPLDSKSYTAKVSGDTRFHVDMLEVSVHGFSKIPVDVPALEVEKFQVPANKNNFSVGGFEVELLKAEQATQETKLQFVCKYMGADIGLFDPSNLVISTEKGEFANDVKKADLELMQQKDKEKFSCVFHIEGKILDMQFATMHIDWKDSFKESKLEDIEGFEINLVLDPGLTAGHNK